MDRQCGDCQLCCALLPVKEIGKAANTRCEYQRHGKGCSLYRYVTFPRSCKVWTCVWLLGADSYDLRRPDRTHYVIDVMAEFVTSRDGDGNATPIPVIQVWVDPKFPDAHRDPALRRFLARRGLEGVAGLIRYGSDKAFFLLPPAMSHTGDFIEMKSNVTMNETEHTPQQIADTLREIL